MGVGVRGSTYSEIVDLRKRGIFADGEFGNYWVFGSGIKGSVE